MQNANRKMDQLGKKMQSVGTNLSVGLTAPLIAFGAVAVANYDKQAKALAQVEQGLLSTGNAVGYTSEELQKMASEFQNNSLFGDEDILKNVTAQLLTFTNITGEQFKRTEQAALDLATRLDGDLKSSSIQLGKALNDPVLGLSALAKSGIQFSEDQKAVIKSMVDTGNVAGAQNLILAELEKQYGGSAAAAAAAGTGSFKQLSNILGDITEDFGKIIVEGLNPFVATLKEMALKFQGLSPATKKFIVVLGGIAAAIGPLLALAGTILPAIGTGFALLTGPIGLVVAGVAAIGFAIYKNWEPIKQTLVDVANYFVDLYNESTIFRLGVEAIITTFKNIFATGKFVFATLGNLISTIGTTIKNIFSNLGAGIKAVLTGDFAALGTLFKNGFTESLDSIGEFVEKSTAEFETLKTNIAGNIDQGIEAGLNGRAHKILAENIDATAVEQTVANAVKNGLTAGNETGPAKEKKVEGISAGIATVGTDSENTGIETIGGLDKQAEELTDFEMRMVEFQESTGGIMEGVAENFAGGFANVLASIATGNVGFGAVGGLLLNTLADLASQLGKAAIKIGITMKAVKLSFSNPFAAIAAGAGLLVVAGIMRSLASGFGGGGGGSPQAFANGGIVGGSSFYGDKILARVNSGELILNQEQQRDVFGMMKSGGSQAYIADTVIRGEDIILSYKRAEQKRKRKGQ